MGRVNGTIRISILDEPEVGLDRMVQDVREGISSTPKDLSRWPKYFYDAEGSKLFEEIMELPEYYQTRTEYAILEDRAEEIIARTGSRELIELGSGSASKTRALIEAMLDTGKPARYVPLDFSESALVESGERLLAEYPELEIRGYVGDFDKSLRSLLSGSENHDGGRLVIFLGGTIGNFLPDERREFLSEIKNGLNAGDHVLIGVDLVKDPKILEAAYDDASGTTARFNKNMLNVFNTRLGANFDPDLFTYRATYEARAQRIEMWLDSNEVQEVNVPALDGAVRFEEGEGMRTEISTKFTLDSTAKMFEDSGLKLLELYTDENNLFGLALGTL